MDKQHLRWIKALLIVVAITVVALASITLSAEPVMAQSTGTIIVEKIGEGSGFTFTSNIPISESFILNAGSTRTMFDIPVGIYTITEDDPGPLYHLYYLSVEDPDVGSSVALNSRTITIDLDDSETVTAIFGNALINNPPVAIDDAYTTDEDTTLNVAAPGVLGNDSDADGDPLTAILVTDVATGILTLGSDGSFSYVPDANFNGTDSFTYVANDGQTDSNVAMVTITVNPVNDPPVADINGPYTAYVGVPITFDGSASFDPDGTIVLYEWDFNDDGVYDFSSLSPTATHTYSIPSAFQVITMRVTDNFGASDRVGTAFEVLPPPNTPPVAIDDAYTTDEDTALNVAAPGVLGNDYDANGDPLTAILVTDVANGILALGSDGSFSYVPDTNFSGTDNFTYVANDGQTDSNVATVTITVNSVNDPPVADANGPYTGDEGSPITLDGSGSSDIDGTIISWEWDLDNDGQYDDATGVTASISFADNGSHIVGLKVTDDQFASDTDSAEVTILNVPPNVDAGPDGVIDEGSAFSSSGSFTDPGADTWMATVDYGDGAGIQPLALNPDKTFSLSHTYADNGFFTITITVQDDDGGVGTDDVTVTVNNVAPSVGAITAPTDPVSADTSITTSADFTDPGTLDTHTALWDWGDGTVSAGTVNETNGSGSVAGSHSYSTPGVYTIILTVTDDDGDSGQSVFQFVVVYDPGAGFVTGGGWIDSPEGAYAPDPSLTGKASFGFVSKYQKGKITPAGNTEFQFKVADLNFHSDSYDWLVIAGHKAMFKGTGTINGEDNYGFMIVAIDEKLTPSTDVDLFRIKIWDKDSNDAVVYDNQMGASDDADPVTAMGGGGIVIHKG